MSNATFVELVGFLVRSPVRGAIAMTLLQSYKESEAELIARVQKELTRIRLPDNRKLSADVQEIREELENLGAAGIILPYTQEGSLWYSFSDTGYKVADAALAPPPAPENA